MSDANKTFVRAVRSTLAASNSPPNPTMGACTLNSASFSLVRTTPTMLQCDCDIFDSTQRSVCIDYSLDLGRGFCQNTGQTTFSDISNPAQLRNAWECATLARSGSTYRLDLQNDISLSLSTSKSALTVLDGTKLVVRTAPHLASAGHLAVLSRGREAQNLFRVIKISAWTAAHGPAELTLEDLIVEGGILNEAHGGGAGIARKLIERKVVWGDRDMPHNERERSERTELPRRKLNEIEPILNIQSTTTKRSIFGFNSSAHKVQDSSQQIAIFFSNVGFAMGPRRRAIRKLFLVSKQNNTHRRQPGDQRKHASGRTLEIFRILFAGQRFRLCFILDRNKQNSGLRIR